MGRIVGGLATSHAFTFVKPELWDEFRAQNRARFRERQGREAPIYPQVDTETDASIAPRFAKIRAALDTLRRQISEARADTLILVGDDQNEVFNSHNIPQIGVYTGGDFALSPRWSEGGGKYRSNAELANSLMAQGVEAGFDLSSIGGFEKDELASHAHAQVLNALLPNADLAVLILFVNAIHVPALPPRRCFQLGQLIRRVVERRPQSERVLICASGGLSHFTAGYPWKHYQGPFEYGGISEAFDRKVIEHIRAGQGDALAELTSQDLLMHGDIELRTWITLLGAIGPVPSLFVEYEPFYRAMTGISVAAWPAAAA